jgi:hypothetical protein
MLYLISTVQVLMFLQLCDWGFCFSGYDVVSLNNQFRVFLRNMMPSECQELVTQSLMLYPRRTTGYPVTHVVYPRRTTGYPVTHVVYYRRTELGTQWLIWYIPGEQLGTQWLMWYIPGEQNWIPSDSCGISQENRTGYPVAHVVYYRRKELGTQWLIWYIPGELGTQWLMWYIPEEQNWLYTPLWYIPEE